MSDLKLEAGTYWKTRDGRKAFVSAVELPNPLNTPAVLRWPVRGYIDGLLRCWCTNGQSNEYAHKHPCDLVAPWREEPKFKVGDRVKSKQGHDFFVTSVYQRGEEYLYVGNGYQMSESGLSLAPPELEEKPSVLDQIDWGDSVTAAWKRAALEYQKERDAMQGHWKAQALAYEAERDVLRGELESMTSAYRRASAERDALKKRVIELSARVDRVLADRVPFAEQFSAKLRSERDALAAKVAKVESMVGEPRKEWEALSVGQVRNALNPPVVCKYGFPRHKMEAERDALAKTAGAWGADLMKVREKRDALAAKVARVEAVLQSMNLTHVSNGWISAGTLRNALGPPAASEKCQECGK